MEPLADLGFALAGYGCTTCIGNSGPLDEPVATAIEDDELVVAAVLSGNRNFEGRVHPLVRAAYLASPPLVVAYALAGRVDIDLTTEPLGIGADGTPGHARRHLAHARGGPGGDRGVASTPRCSARPTASVFEGDEQWRAIAIPQGDRYAWDEASTYIANPPFFAGPDRGARAAHGHRGRPRAGGPRRLGDHRPHQPRRVHRRLVARRHVAPGARRGPGRLQLVRLPPRPSRGDDARHLRQHPPAEPAGRGQGGAVHGPPARRRGRRSSTTPRCATGTRASRS